MPKATLHLLSGESGDVIPHIDPGAVFNALDLAILVLDAHGKVLDANVAAEQILGCRADAIRGSRLSDFAPVLKDVEYLAGIAADRAISVSERGVDITGINQQQGRIVVDVAASPLPDFPGCSVVRMIETTVSHAIDRRLGYLGAARAVSAMASVLAHEVKNPLSGIRGASQLLDRHVPDSERGLTDLIRNEVDRICGLVDRMGQVSNASDMHPMDLNIHKVLDHVHALAENGFASHLAVLADYDPSLPPVSGDRDLLIQAFLNLVKNAAEAAPLKNGQITLRTSYVSGIRFSAGQPEKAQTLPICVEITDNGTGIPSDLLDHLFDPFVTSRPGGSGLGLALTAKIISNHGGLIDFDTSPGGTTFRVLLPVHPTPGTDP